MKEYFVYADYCATGEGRTAFVSIVKADNIKGAKKMLEDRIPDYFSSCIEAKLLGSKACKTIIRNYFDSDTANHLETSWHKELFMEMHFNHC